VACSTYRVSSTESIPAQVVQLQVLLGAALERIRELEVETIVEERGIPIAGTAGNRGLAPPSLDQNPAPSVGGRASGCGRQDSWVSRAWQDRSERSRREAPVLPSLLRKTGACRRHRGRGGCRPPELASADPFLVFRSAQPALHVGCDRGRRDRFAALLEDRLQRKGAGLAFRDPERPVSAFEAHCVRTSGRTGCGLCVPEKRPVPRPALAQLSGIELWTGSFASGRRIRDATSPPCYFQLYATTGGLPQDPLCEAQTSAAREKQRARRNPCTTNPDAVWPRTTLQC
jgi:hypothetical protein